jgi:selenocysteine lyase/cysteine desulfurase
MWEADMNTQESELSRREFLAAGAGGLALASTGRTLGPAGDPLGVRSDFPAALSSLYLNSAYIAPSPVPVMEAGQAFLRRKLENPIPLGEMLAKTDEVRGQFARLINASPDEIGFLFTTSEGENIIANALDLKRGDNVVVDELHYDTTFVLYRHLEQAKGIELRIVKHQDGRVAAEDYQPFVDQRTKIVSVSWVSHQNGFHHQMRPLADLAHAHGAFFYADAIQAAGMVPIDVATAGVDGLSAGCYKWLLGGFGPAAFYLRQSWADRIGLDRFGALHVAKEEAGHQYQIFANAKRFDYATLPFAEIYQLGAGLAYLERVGVDRIEAHTTALAHTLRHGLIDRGLTVLTPADNRSSIVACANPKGLDAAKAILDPAKARVSIREGGSQIRIAPALFNTEEDINRYLSLAEQLR